MGLSRCIGNAGPRVCGTVVWGRYGFAIRLACTADCREPAAAQMSGTRSLRCLRLCRLPDRPWWQERDSAVADCCTTPAPSRQLFGTSRRLAVKRSFCTLRLQRISSPTTTTPATNGRLKSLPRCPTLHVIRWLRSPPNYRRAISAHLQAS